MVFFFFQCYDHVESSVRKASVFCLVAIHSAVGEETLMPHLAELSGTKVRIYSRQFIVIAYGSRCNEMNFSLAWYKLFKTWVVDRIRTHDLPDTVIREVMVSKSVGDSDLLFT